MFEKSYPDFRHKRRTTALCLMNDDSNLVSSLHSMAIYGRTARFRYSTLVLTRNTWMLTDPIGLTMSELVRINCDCQKLSHGEAVAAALNCGFAAVAVTEPRWIKITTTGGRFRKLRLQRFSSKSFPRSYVHHVRDF